MLGTTTITNFKSINLKVIIALFDPFIQDEIGMYMASDLKPIHLKDD